ncbi:ABC efflux pump, inner membrane subunit [Candidatus Koribacter versatilis Ellin345]|uniref:ABC efflux pump, inner membrane subunit n=1 Tax=Koribacter versatilis (strain Ellin345) TaxID=204669 RepID=Q1IHS8_KORVE|nr:ABC transporter permease [Candidatus Koribacter versatilis]ABF43572.1 ABC efflux pump, inner membrane subunit [Candidatus Koribacter versatilis Ellin345]
MGTLLSDLRFSFRQLVKNPGLSLTAIVSLAFGIGATTAVFSVVWAILMNPYPYANNDRMYHMRLWDIHGRQTGFGLTAPQWQELKKSPVIEDAFLVGGWNLTVTGSDVPEDLNGVYMSSNSMNFLGVPALLGRGLIPADAVDGQDPQPIVVLGNKFWHRHYNGDPSVIGKNIQLVRKNYTIVGVMPPRFTWEDGDVYTPEKITQDPVKAYYVGIRLKPGVTRAQANAALEPLIVEFQKQSPSHFGADKFRFTVVGLNDDFLKDLGGTLALLICAVGLLLAIGCGNVSILLLARGTARQHEFAVRSAIGASRQRIVRQLLTESLMLALTGAALGVLLSWKTIQVITDLLPKYSFPHEAEIRLNVPVLVFSVLISIFAGVLFGMWPALQFSRPNVSEVMQSSTRKIVGNVRGRGVYNALIGGQIALTMLLLAGAGAAMEGFLKMMHAPLGYDPHNVMSVGIPVHDGTYKTWESRVAYFEQLQKKIAEVPGVKMTSIAHNATPPANGFEMKAEVLGESTQSERKIRINLVDPQYFPILRVPLAQGRIWNESENHNAAHLAVINETMAKQFFPNGDAIGHSIKMAELKPEPPYFVGTQGSDDWMQVVGIVADKKNDGLSKPVKPEAFIPNTIAMGMFTQILVRSDASPLTLLHAIKLKVSSVDPDQQVNGQVDDLEHWISSQQEWQNEHLIAWLFGAFAVLALLLASVGLYSVVSYSVAQRTNEFGIRVALGAQRGHVLKIVFSSAIGAVAGGMGAGLVLALASSKLLAHWSEHSVRDPLILVGVTVVLGVVALLSCVVPARKALGIDPMTALRYE